MANTPTQFCSLKSKELELTDTEPLKFALLHTKCDPGQTNKLTCKGSASTDFIVF